MKRWGVYTGSFLLAGAVLTAALYAQDASEKRAERVAACKALEPYWGRNVDHVAHPLHDISWKFYRERLSALDTSDPDSVKRVAELKQDAEDWTQLYVKFDAEDAADYPHKDLYLAVRHEMRVNHYQSFPKYEKQYSIETLSVKRDPMRDISMELASELGKEICPDVKLISK